MSVLAAAVFMLRGAFARGAACKKDMTESWDLWKDVERPVRELREEWGITPITHVGDGVQPGYVP